MILSLSLVAALAICSPWSGANLPPESSARPGALKMWYSKPAAPGMNEALPIGAGRLGALVYGGIEEDGTVINEDSLWTGGSNPSGVYESMGAYQKLGDVRISLPSHAGAADYRRDLDLASATAHVSYRANGVTYHREYFASHPAQLIIIRLTADRPAAYTGRISLLDAHQEPTTTSPGRLAFAGALANGITYRAMLSVNADGGSISISGDSLAFKACSSITILVAAGTSYTMNPKSNYQGDAPTEKLMKELAVAGSAAYSHLRMAHVADYRRLFDRVTLDLGRTAPERAAEPTDERKLSAAAGGDPELEALLFQYGRYLLIACSRPGSLPANLQGLWNDSNTPPWSSDYHANINVEMNYWPAEVCNLSECAEPLFNLVESQLPDWRVATTEAPEFKLKSGAPVRGWALRTSHNVTGGMGWNWDKTANAWYCLHFWEHYAFTGDKQFLRQRAYPVIKEICQFWEDHLKALPDGRLVVPDGWSPEHGPVEDGCSYNQEIVWDLFTNYVQAATALGIDSDYRDKIADMRDKLVTPQIGRWGQLQEWMEDRDDENDHHRHTSHLFGVYPGRQFSAVATPKMSAAARKSLVARGDSGDVREWSFAWRTALYARLDDGDAAYGQLKQLFSARNSCPNLFGLHPPMQIDGNFGATAGIAEMLLQSQAGEVQLLPALPAAWKDGAITGLCARGGFTVDLSWRGGRLVKGTLHSRIGGACKLRYGAQTMTMQTHPGGSFDLGNIIGRQAAGSFRTAED